MSLQLTDLQMLQLAWQRAELDLATAVLLQRDGLSLVDRQEVSKQLEGTEVTPARSVLRWALRHPELASRGPMHAYVAFHGLPDAQEVCVAADAVAADPRLNAAEFLARALRAAQHARVQVRGEQATQDAIRGARA